MAGRPLRPATRRSLGEPLPHQQADRPRVHPQPKKSFQPTRCLASSYPVLATVSDCYPRDEGRLLTCYSPVRHSCTPEGALPFDLHVLSTPPAFVLSQDQTLHRKNQTHPHPHKNADTGTSKKFNTEPNHRQTPTTHTNKCAHRRGKSIKGKKQETNQEQNIPDPSPKMALT